MTRLDGFMAEAAAEPSEIAVCELGPEDLQLFADGIPELCWMAPADGYIFWYNKRWYDYTGTTHSDMAGWGWQSVHDPSVLPSVLVRWNASIATGQAFEMTFPLRGVDGAFRPFLTRVRPLARRDGKIHRWVGINTDVTEAVEREAELIRSQCSLRESQALLGAIFETAPVGIVVAKAPSGRIMSCNRQADIMLSHTAPASAESRSYEQTWISHHPDGRPVEAAEYPLARALAGEDHPELEVIHQGPDQQWTWLRFAAAPISIEGNVTGAVGVILDIDKKMRAIEALSQVRVDLENRIVQEVAARELGRKNYEELLDRTGQIARVGGWEMDVGSGTVSWTKETGRIHGLDAEALATLDDAFSFYPGDARSTIEAAVSRGISHGAGWDLELPFISATGERIWVRAVGKAEIVDGSTRRLYGVFQDITEIVRARMELATLNKRMSLAADSGGIGVWDYDLRSGGLLWDEWMYRIYGIEARTQLASYGLWAACLHPEDRHRVEGELQDAIEGGAQFQTQFRIKRKDGRIRHVRGTARIVRDEFGRPSQMIGANWDVTEVADLMQDLSEQHELLRVTLASIGDAVITTDETGRIRWMNPVAERMTGWNSDDACGRPSQQVFHIVNEQSRLPAESPISVCLAQKSMIGLANSTILISRHDDEFSIEKSAAPILSDEGAILGVVLVFHDVSEQRSLAVEMTYRAKHDTLTGLVNRTEFECRLTELLRSVSESECAHALMYLDLDQFKIVNDTCGHSAGDQLLCQVSKVLGERIRSQDTLARLGGDEFAVIMKCCTVDQAQLVAQDICSRLDHFRFLHDGRAFRIGASIGLVSIDDSWTTASSLMQIADLSCYAAKEAGRGRVFVWNESDATINMRRGEIGWAARIEQSIDEGGFCLFAQRIRPFAPHQYGTYAEVLVRMQEPDGTMISPGVFMPIAERFHLAARLDRVIVAKAIDWISTVPELDSIELLCINLSGQSVGDRAFQKSLLQLIQLAGAEVAGKICFEVTETAAITNLTDVSFLMERLRTLGVRIALDDFGAGASSFRYLKQLPLDFLKIDGQFITGILNDPLNKAAVKCFVEVASVRGLQTIAEFVDSQDTLDQVREMGIDFAQGFLIHKPEPIERLGFPATSLPPGYDRVDAAY